MWDAVSPTGSTKRHARRPRVLSHGLALDVAVYAPFFSQRREATESSRMYRAHSDRNSTLFRFALYLAATCILVFICGCWFPTRSAGLESVRSSALPADKGASPAIAVDDVPEAPMQAEVAPRPARPILAMADNPPRKESGDSEDEKVKGRRQIQSLDEKLLFYPAKFPEGDWHPTEIQFVDAWFRTDDGIRIHGWYCPHVRPRAVVLYAHGNAGNLAHRAGVLQILQQQLHCSVLIFDYRGYGRSEGKPTVKGILSDARAARAELARLAKVKTSEIVLMGRSLGGAVVVQLAAESAPRGLVLESTFSSFRDVAKVHFPLLAWAVPAGKLDSAGAITRYRGPLLQSHGDVDRTVPFAVGRKLFEAANEPKQWVTISGGDHNQPPTRDYYAKLDQFLQSLPN